MCVSQGNALTYGSGMRATSFELQSLRVLRDVKSNLEPWTLLHVLAALIQVAVLPLPASSS